MKKHSHLALRCRQRLPAERSRPVYPPERLAVSPLGRPQVPLPFETLEKRIQAPGTDAVSVTRQPLDHPQTEDRAFHGVVENMEPDQARIQVTVGGNIFLLCIRFRHRITNEDIMGPNGGICQAPLWMAFLPLPGFLQLVVNRQIFSNQPRLQFKVNAVSFSVSPCFRQWRTRSNWLRYRSTAWWL